MTPTLAWRPSPWLRDTFERVTSTAAQTALGFLVGVPVTEAIVNAPVPIQTLNLPVILGATATASIVSFLKCVVARRRGGDDNSASLLDLTK